MWTFDGGRSLSTYLTVSTKETAFLIRCPDELLGGEGLELALPSWASGVDLDFWPGGCVSESKPEPDSAVGHSPPLHMADPTQLKRGVQHPDLHFPARDHPQLSQLQNHNSACFMSCACWLWGKKIILWKNPSSNNPKVSDAVPGTFCLAQQGRRQ